jgi:oligopeptide transport system permease protein
MAVPVWLGVSLVIFSLMHVAPGGPFDQERELPPEVKANLLHQYGLDQPLWQQYALYVSKAARADFGMSLKFRELSVAEIIGDRFPVSLQIGLLAIGIMVLVGIPLGMLSALRQNQLTDYLGMAFALICYGTPPFVLALVLILTFSLGLHLLPVSGWGQPQHLILPAIVLGIRPAAVVARLTRAGMIEVLHQEYTRTARGKGLGERAVVVRHALKNALIPVVTAIGLQASELITGSIVVEYIFSVPGLGQMFVTSLTSRDYPLVMGVALFYATLILLSNLLVDLSYGVIDPRIRSQTA